MKNHIIITSLLFAAVFIGCTDLEEHPYGFYSDKNFYQNPEEAEIAMLYAYNAFDFNEYRRGYFDITDLPTETMDLKSGELQNGRTELHTWNVSSLTEGLNNIFKYSYIGINRSNAVIENLQDIEFDVLERNHLIGEALFLRSWHTFMLVRLFGEVPLRTKMVAEITDIEASLSSIQQIYMQLLADLEEAANKMQIRRSLGRADKVAAQSLLSKVYLTIASSAAMGTPRFEWVTNADDMYAKAAGWAGKVINEQREYGLDPEIMHIYDVDAWDGPEHIFLLASDRSKPSGVAGISDMFNAYNNSHPYYFKNADGSFSRTDYGWEVYKTNPDYFATFPAGDQRASQLYTDQIFDEFGEEILWSNWIICRKYTDSDPNAQYNRNSARPFFIRYSDIALVYAEAQGPTTEGYAMVNAIRTRAGLADLTPGLSVEDFRAAIFEERGWELNFEGHRLFELRRLHRVVEKLGNVDYAYYYPLPQEEVDLNPNIDADPDKKSLR